MGEFKFLDQNIPDQPEETVLPVVIRDPSVVLRLNRNRNTISELEWDSIIQQQRRQLIEYMWQQGMIMHTIIYEDENGFSLRTEILF
jgi:hypothetical protein